MRKGVLRNFLKLTGKQLCQSLFLNKVLINSLFGTCVFGGFRVHFAKFLKSPFLQNTSGRLLLYMQVIMK